MRGHQALALAAVRARIMSTHVESDFFNRVAPQAAKKYPPGQHASRDDSEHTEHERSEQSILDAKAKVAEAEITELMEQNEYVLPDKYIADKAQAYIRFAQKYENLLPRAFSSDMSALHARRGGLKLASLVSRRSGGSFFTEKSEDLKIKHEFEKAVVATVDKYIDGFPTKLKEEARALKRRLMDAHCDSYPEGILYAVSEIRKRMKYDKAIMREEIKRYKELRVLSKYD